MLHILNGDSSAETLRLSSVEGKKVPWREALMDGPTPEGLSQDEWEGVRARHLSGAYAVELEACRQELSRGYREVAAFSEHDEVVLWFESDLFCQVNLIHLLSRLSERERGETRLSLICIDSFPGKEKFKGLGELNEVEMASLMEGRGELGEAHLKLARRAWRAYCSPDPREIESLLAEDTSLLPFLKSALAKHLARFPSIRNGLGAVQNTALEIMRGGVKEFGSIFREFWKAEPVYGIGDSQFWNDLKPMFSAGVPLLILKGIDDPADPAAISAMKEASFEITDEGQSVLAGNENFVEMNGIERWLGGVHLTGKTAAWQWDEAGRALTRSPAS